MDALIVGLVAWICAQTGMLAPPPPRVLYVPQAQLSEMMQGPLRENALSVNALYAREKETIYLADGWKPDNVRSISALVHELVHHLQNFNKVPAPCLAAYERQAYDLQILWLREQGVEDPYALLDINEFAILLLSRCSWD